MTIIPLRAAVISRQKAWLLATRPKTLTVAVVPVVLASCLAWHQAHMFDGIVFLCCLAVALLLQIGTNLINDSLDFKRGADNENRLGPMRVTQSGLIPMRQVWIGGMFCFALAIVVGIPLIWKGGATIAILLGLSVACGYLYTGGPKPLAYVGLGECFAFLFFGVISTMAVYYLQTGKVALSACVAGIQIGALETVLLAINNLRDCEEDVKANKRTLAVRFGTTFARWEITVLLFLPFLLGAYWVLNEEILAASLPWLTLPLAVWVAMQVWWKEPGRVYNKLLGLTALLHLMFGLLLALSL